MRGTRTVACPVARARDTDVAPFTILVSTVVRTALTGVMLMVKTRHWLRLYHKNLLSGTVSGSMKLDTVNDNVLHFVKIQCREGGGWIFKLIGILRVGVDESRVFVRTNQRQHDNIENLLHRHGRPTLEVLASVFEFDIPGGDACLCYLAVESHIGSETH